LVGKDPSAARWSTSTTRRAGADRKAGRNGGPFTSCRRVSVRSGDDEPRGRRTAGGAADPGWPRLGWCPVTMTHTVLTPAPTGGHLLGYARVSTAEQDVRRRRLQQDALTAVGCYRTFTDTASGVDPARTELTAVLDGPELLSVAPAANWDDLQTGKWTIA